MAIPAISRFHEELDNNEFQAFCISLAREIDGAIWKNMVPENVQELILYLNNACRRRCDDATKAVVMTLMISVKNACQLGWFPQRETRGLMDIVDSMWNDFGCPENAIPSVNSPSSVILQVIERFYPFVKLGHTLVSFEAKAESFIHVKDFHVSEKMQHSSKQMVGLFVVRTEDISKSNCIIHPQEVSFLLNGTGVENRFNISMDSGPQLPTDVTAMLNDGTNLLQTIGCYRGSYLIVIGSMDVIPLSEADKPLLKDYVHSQVNESNSDCDIIEGPSRISLKCPISRTRIKLPVKGHVCKHLQCFDFWNYVNINMRRPSWRCPHCNQSVCYTDICVDQNMIKILEGVDCNAEAVVISADGSWKVVRETDENVELTPETTHDCRDPNSIQNLGPTVLDLTCDETEMETSGGTQVYKQKHLCEIQGLSNNTDKLPTECTMLNQSSASKNALPQWPHHLNAFNGQQCTNLPQLVNIQDSTARQAPSMSLLPTTSPQDRLATNTSSLRTSVPDAQFQGSHTTSSQFQGSRVATSQDQGSHIESLEHCLGRTSDLMDRWNHIYRIGINQTQSSLIPPLQHHYAMQNQRLSIRSLSPAQQKQRHMQRPIPSSTTHPQNLSVNYGGNADQRPTQRLNHDGAMGQFSSREFMNSDSPNTVVNRMRGSIAPGSTGYDHMIIRPTRPAQAQAQTLPPPQQTPYNSNRAEEIQAFLANPSYPGGLSQTQAGVGEDVEPGLYYTMPPETW
ncbi:unnamed protein product [Cochlearia groenlandica]